jgi:hypothetical protein
MHDCAAMLNWHFWKFAMPLVRWILFIASEIYNFRLPLIYWIFLKHQLFIVQFYLLLLLKENSQQNTMVSRYEWHWLDLVKSTNSLLKREKKMVKFILIYFLISELYCRTSFRWCKMPHLLTDIFCHGYEH